MKKSLKRNLKKEVPGERQPRLGLSRETIQALDQPASLEHVEGGDMTCATGSQIVKTLTWGDGS